MCASIQAAIVEVLVKKTIRAAKRNHVRCVIASGGITCNRALRRELARACEREGFDCVSRKEVFVRTTRR